MPRAGYGNQSVPHVGVVVIALAILAAAGLSLVLAAKLLVKLFASERTYVVIVVLCTVCTVLLAALLLLQRVSAQHEPNVWTKPVVRLVM